MKKKRCSLLKPRNSSNTHMDPFSAYDFTIVTANETLYIYGLMQDCSNAIANKNVPGPDCWVYRLNFKHHISQAFLVR